MIDISLNGKKIFNRKFSNLNKYSISETLRGKAKEEQSAFYSPLDCSLQVDTIFFQVDMYRFADFIVGSNSFIRDYPLNCPKRVSSI